MASSRQPATDFCDVDEFSSAWRQRRGQPAVQPMPLADGVQWAVGPPAIKTFASAGLRRSDAAGARRSGRGTSLSRHDASPDSTARRPREPTVRYCFRPEVSRSSTTFYRNDARASGIGSALVHRFPLPAPRSPVLITRGKRRPSGSSRDLPPVAVNAVEEPSSVTTSFSPTAFRAAHRAHSGCGSTDIGSGSSCSSPDDSPRPDRRGPRPRWA